MDDSKRRRDTREAFTNIFDVISKLTDMTYMRSGDAQKLAQNFNAVASGWLDAERRIEALLNPAPPPSKETSKFELPEFLKGLPQYQCGATGVRHEMLQISEFKKDREREAARFMKSPLPSIPAKRKSSYLMAK
jgi:hypothetical protein